MKTETPIPITPWLVEELETRTLLPRKSVPPKIKKITGNQTKKKKKANPIHIEHKRRLQPEEQEKKIKIQLRTDSSNAQLVNDF